MGEVLELMGALSPGVKLGWLVFAAWTLAQAGWYVRTRVPATAPAKPARKRSRNSSARRPAVRVSPRRARAAESDTSGPEFLASLGLVQTPGISEYGVPMSSAGQSGPSVIA